MTEQLTPEIIGKFIDSITENSGIARRTPASVAGRFIEEAVELCLAAGLDPNTIMGHVMDSIHNQCGKLGRRKNIVLYPSQHHPVPEAEEMAEELADCHLLLKDFAFISGLDYTEAERVKWAKFTRRKFNVGPNGTVYAIKSSS